MAPPTCHRHVLLIFWAHRQTDRQRSSAVASRRHFGKTFACSLMCNMNLELFICPAVLRCWEWKKRWARRESSQKKDNWYFCLVISVRYSVWLADLYLLWDKTLNNLLNKQHMPLKLLAFNVFCTTELILKLFDNIHNMNFIKLYPLSSIL